MGSDISFIYDQLNQLLSESRNYLGTVSYQYDVSGNVTRITWPDGFWVSYEYDNTGAVTAIREYGATLLASYAFRTGNIPARILRVDGL